MRGLPGSGKSTHIKRMIQKYHGLVGGFSSVVCSADNYFYRPDGTYDWSAKMLDNAHKWCFKQVEENMQPDFKNDDD